MAIYYYCSRIMPDTKSWEDLKILLNMDLEGKRRKITFISGWINDKPKSKSYRNGASKNLVELGIDMEDFTLLWKNSDRNEMVDTLLDSDLVYLLGGNPIEQTEYIRNNELEQTLQSYEGIIVGVSGGAMTMSKKVVVPRCGERYPDSKAIDGIALTDMSIFPHFECSEEIETKDGIINNSDLMGISRNIDILGISNESAIRCGKEGIYVFGDTPHILSRENIYPCSYIEWIHDKVKIKKLVL